MSKIKEKACLKRLFEMAPYTYEDIHQFLIDEKLISQFESDGLKSSNDKPAFVHMLLSVSKNSDKLTLLFYEWNILPKESIKVTISTERLHREFIANE